MSASEYFSQCPECGAPVRISPPTWEDPARGWCWRCRRPLTEGAPKALSAPRDAWVLEVFDATAEEAERLAGVARAAGLRCKASRGTVAGVFYKRARGLE